MALKLYGKSVDGSIPIRALLYDDEQLVASQDGVGIYEGNQKSVMHQSGSVHVTTHRLFYLDGIDDLVHSFAFGLEHVNRTDFYGGLFTSSAKVTLFLNPLENTQSGSSGLSDSDQAVFVAWECHVCGNKNAPGLSPQAATICGLCGIPRDDSSSSPSVPTPQKAPLSSSLPSTSFSSPALPVSQTTADEDDEGGINIKREPIPCPACTFLNHPYLRTCEICDTELPKPPRGPMKSAPSSRPVSPPVDLDDAESESRRHIIKISFRKGGEKQFYASLKLCLQRKGWASQGMNKRRSMPNLARNSGDEGIRSGISGVLQNVEYRAQDASTTLFDAFQDLEALRVKAQDMVALAAELNQKLTASTATKEIGSVAEDMNARDPHTKVLNSNEPEEAKFIRSSLSQLGLEMKDAPVTMDMMKDETRWISELAKELAGVLQGSGGKGGLMKERGIVPLDEIWGGWNRARGVSLIPPSTFLQILPLLPRYTEPPIKLRKFSSGLSVLHTPPFSNSSFTSRLCSFLVLSGPQTTMAIAQEEGLTIGMTAMMLNTAEAMEDIVRDDVANSAIVAGGFGDVEWHPNMFTGYVWDGEPDN